MPRDDVGALVDNSPNDTGTSDEDLIRRVVAGDTDRYRDLADRHQGALFALVFRQVGDRAVATEIAQAALVKGYFGLKRFKFRSKFSSWLIRIALNETNSYFTSKSFKRQKLQESFDVERHDVVQPQSSEMLDLERKLQSFRRALPGLKPKFREVITLCSLEGKSYEEAAAILEIPVGTVRSRLNTARLLLRNAIAREMERSETDES